MDRTDDMREIVTTIDLPWVTDADDMLKLCQSYGVTLELLAERTTTLAVRVHGPRGNVEQCVGDNWCSNSLPGTDERQIEVAMLLGDTLAEHRFSTGCEIGLAGNDLEQIQEDKLGWSHHWDKANVVRSGDEMHRSNEAAIEMLVGAGYQPSDTLEHDPVELAQSYLMLAFAHCPDLVKLVPPVRSPREVHYDLMVRAMKNMDLKTARKHLNVIELIDDEN